MRGVVLALVLFLAGCGTLIPSVSTTAVSSGVGCVVGGLTGVGLPAGCVAGAAIGDGIGELIYKDEEPVRDVWGLLSELINISGWLIAVYIGLTVLLPFLAGWLIPQPRRRKDESDSAGE